MQRRSPAADLPNAAGPDGAYGSHRDADELSGYRFAGFAFDLRRGELRDASGATIGLRPKAEALLRSFLARPEHLLGREELMAAVWGTTVVTDDSLVQCVRELRLALGDREQALIRTVPRRGYRFDAAVEALHDARVEESLPPVGTRLASAAADAGARPVAPVPSGGLGRPASSAALGLALIALVLTGGSWMWQQARGRSGIDEQVRAMHVFSVMPFAVASDDPALLALAETAADHVAVQLATRPGSRVYGPARSAMLAGKPLADVARALGAVYVLNGRVRTPVEPAHAAVVDVQLLATASGEVIGGGQFPLGRDPDAGLLLGQEVMNFARPLVGAIDEAAATQAGHEPSPAELTMLGWNNVTRRRDAQDRSLARSRFEQALRSDPDSVLALTGLGAVYLQEKTAESGPPPRADQHAASEAAIARAVRLAPENATAAMLWGMLQQIKGRPDLAIAAFEKSNRITPGFGNGHLMLARALLSVGRFSEVDAEVDRAVRLFEGSHEYSRLCAALQLGAEAALMRGDDPRALLLARRAVAESPRNAQAHAVLAAAEWLNGNRNEAVAQMRTYLQTSPRAATVEQFDQGRPSNEVRYVAARQRLYVALRDAGLGER